MSRLAPLLLITLLASLGCRESVLNRSVVALTGADYVDARALDLRRLLPDAPANDSAVTTADLAELLRLQNTRTTEDCEYAGADAVAKPERFAAALGLPADWTIASTPAVSTLLARVRVVEGLAIRSAKQSYARPRPYRLDSRITPCIDLPGSESYPSGHSAWAVVTALVLANLVPERRAQLLDRADEIAQHRAVGGVHYPSDIAAGKTAGVALAALLFASPAFQADEIAARQELRSALGLSATH